MQVNNVQPNSLSLNRFENTKTVNQPIFKGNKNIFMSVLKQNSVSFKGNIAASAYNSLTDVLAKGLGKFADTKFSERAVRFLSGESNNKALRWIGQKMNFKNKWFQHLIAAESIYLTGFYMYNTKKSKAIPEDQKRTMMTNQALVTTLCTALGYTLDSKINKVFNKVKQVYTATNVIKTVESMKDKVLNAKALAKDANALENAIISPLKKVNGVANGISKLKSVLVFGFIYRYFSPVFITPIANRVSEWLFDKKKDDKTALKKAA